MAYVLIAPPTVTGPPFDIVFLDRDGTLNAQVDGYVARASELHLLPGAAEAVAALNRSGARVVVVTNQQGIAAGKLTELQLAQVHAALGDELATHGAHLDAILVCPHLQGTCGCRKPLPGLFLTALDTAQWAHAENCAMIGDSVTDLIPAACLGLRTVLVGAESQDASWERAGDLRGAVDLLLGAEAVMQEGGGR
jgi:histidinol-phosphate phosphatase family protein